MRSILLYFPLSFMIYTANTFAVVEETSAYFNTSFLIQYDKVQSALIKDGFHEVNFYSQDGLKLNGLFLNRQNATSNIILCCGFYPGRKEGLAAFYHLLPKNCNILMFDARGHGKSEGLFLSKIPFYGLHEYKDITGAIHFLTQQNKLPTVILGICAGAYHAVRAIDALQKNDSLSSLNIKGLILDSSIISLAESTQIPTKYFRNAILPSQLRSYFYPNQKKSTIRKTVMYQCISFCISPMLTLLEYFLWPCAILRKEAIDIRPLCARINIPIFFIHAQNDNYVPFELAHSCIDYASKHWWPEQSEHACIYLKYKQAYQDHLHDFLDTILLA